MLLKTNQGRNIAVNADTYKGEKYFNADKHLTHFADCYYNKQFIKKDNKNENI
jgi:hypothetical protein